MYGIKLIVLAAVGCCMLLINETEAQGIGPGAPSPMRGGIPSRRFRREVDFAEDLLLPEDSLTENRFQRDTKAIPVDSYITGERFRRSPQRATYAVYRRPVNNRPPPMYRI